MENIKKRVVISPDRILHLDVELPESLPLGLAEVVLLVSPASSVEDSVEAINSLAGSLSDSPRFSGDPVAIQRKLRDEWN